MSSMFPLTGAAEDLWFDTAQYTTAVTTLLSCTRASSGYAKNLDGTLTSFGTNTLRLGVGTGLLVEDAVQNICLYSQEIDHTAGSIWNLAGSTILADQIAAPDGTTTAEKLTEDSSNGVHAVYQAVTTANSVPYTYSVYAKNGTRQFFAVNVGDGGSADRYTAVFDLVNGTITDSGTVGTITATSSSIEALANGWYRCILTATRSAGSNIVIGLNLSNSGTPSYDAFKQVTYTGGGSAFVYVWGAQIEQASFPSSYILTTSGAATRAADAVSVSGNLDTIMQSATATAVVDLKAITTSIINPGFNPGIVFAVSGSIAGTSGQTTGINIFDAGATHQLTGTLGSGSYGTGAKLGWCWNVSGRSIVGNAGTLQTDAFGSMGSTGYHLGRGASIYNYAYFRRLTVWNTRLADATLVQLSDPTSAFYSEPTTLFAQACM